MLIARLPAGRGERERERESVCVCVCVMREGSARAADNAETGRESRDGTYHDGQWTRIAPMAWLWTHNEHRV